MCVYWVPAKNNFPKNIIYLKMFEIGDMDFVYVFVYLWLYECVYLKMCVFMWVYATTRVCVCVCLGVIFLMEKMFGLSSLVRKL